MSHSSHHQDEQQHNADSTVVPPSQKGMFLQFVKTIATTTADLSSLSCPAFLLEGTSLLEHEASYMMYPDYVFSINDCQDPAERMLKVVGWWILNTWQSYGAPFHGGRAVKKPYNPILGEQFRCHWEDPQSKWKKVSLICEQVSHHPPVSAFYFENKELGVCVNGSLLTKTRFRATAIKVDNKGYVCARFQQHNDEYRIDFPEAYLRGILSGHVFVELIGTSTIVSRSGYVATVNFLGKPWFSGEHHRFEGTVAHVSSPKKPIYTFSGKWVGQSEAAHVASGKTSPLVDVNSPSMKPIIPPLEQQSDLESIKVWNSVSKALAQEDYSTAMKEKNIVEERQRAQRKQREKDGVEWHPTYFRPASPSIDWIDPKDLEDSGPCFWIYKDILPLQKS